MLLIDANIIIFYSFSMECWRANFATRINQRCSQAVNPRSYDQDWRLVKQANPNPNLRNAVRFEVSVKVRAIHAYPTLGLSVLWVIGLNLGVPPFYRFQGLGLRSQETGFGEPTYNHNLPEWEVTGKAEFQFRRSYMIIKIPKVSMITKCLPAGAKSIMVSKIV